ncbi:MAG: hypothetical protein A2X49_08890 [Lentisphaerae bacterium GWF2_52_8]|nr:MAG: hypothetical protein A2X49_08890 [Lentisphaerae bacterium GWF2_52_8]
MSPVGLFSNSLSKVRSFFADPVERACNSLAPLFEKEAADSAHGNRETPVTTALISLFGDIIWVDGRMAEKEIDLVRKFLSGRYSPPQVENFLLTLKSHPASNIERDAAPLLHFSESERLHVLEALCEVAAAAGDISDSSREMLSSICRELHLPPESLSLAERVCIDNKVRQVRLLRSGTGLLVALLVIAVFVLAATFLKSVLFGLIFAYFFLPLEKWYEKHVFSNPRVRSFLGFFTRIPSIFRRSRPQDSSKQLRAASICRQTVGRACAATYLTVFLSASVLTGTGIFLSLDFFEGASSSIKKWAASAQTERPAAAVPEVLEKAPPTGQASAGSLKEFVSGGIAKLEALRGKLDRFPVFTWANKQVSEYLSEDNARDSLRNALVQQSGGLWAFILKSMSRFFSFLLGILLTVFFFSFFLHQMALFSAERLGDKTSPVEYVVNGIFGSGWLPNTDADARRDAREILENILLRLRTWVRGYLSIILIEAILYTMSFLVIGVPHAVVLGLVAGCAVLLPFVGLLSSISLTVLVCLAAGGEGGMLTAAVALSVYAVINGILEQFILYPKLIGAALGLSTLETVIIVLLGACLGGLPGMLLAVPCASILKYLIPQIYRCWRAPDAEPEPNPEEPTAV